MTTAKAPKTVLIVSRFFPPMYDVGSKRAWRFAKYLPLHGWRAVVITDRAPLERPVDPSLEIPPDVEVVREYYPDFWPRPTGAGSDGTVAAPIDEAPSQPGGPLRRALRQVQVPVGEEIVLAPRFAWVARRVARRTGARAIFATSSPYSALVFGAAAARVTGLPLCLDLRDPWSLNFLQKRKPPWVQRAEASVEEGLLAAADRVTFTSQATADAYRTLYPRLPPDRVRTIYNSFDPDHRPAPSAPADDVVRIVHFGNVYGRRTLAPFLHALALLRDRGGPDATRLRLVNLGRVTEADLALATRLGVREQVEYRPFVPYHEGLAVLASASVQLLLGYGDETLFVPAKLFDYLLTGVPILCVAPPSELTRIITDTGAGAAVDPGDVAAIAAALTRALASPRALAGRARDDQAIARFSAPETARELAGLLDEMVLGRAAR